MTGVADGIFRRGDGSYLIVDYKTARLTRVADAMFPVYRTQLNVYALIAEAVGFAPVSGLALIYTEPITDEESATRVADLRSKTFAMGFSAHVVEVPLNGAQIPPLLRRAREILNSPVPVRLAGCKDCARVDWMRAALA
jgi:hypothetical protein